MVTLLLVLRLRASFGQAVRHVQEHPYLSTRESGSNSPCSVPGQQGDKPRSMPSVLFSSHHHWLIWKWWTGCSALGRVERHWCRSWDRNNPGGHSELQLPLVTPQTSRGAAQATAVPTDTDRTRNPYFCYCVFCNMHPWQQTEGSRDPSSTHPFNTLNQLFWSPSAYISFAPSCWANTGL